MLPCMIKLLLLFIVLMQFGCCSNAYFPFGVACEASLEECEPLEEPPNENENQVGINISANGGGSAVLYSVVSVTGSLIIAGLAVMF